MSEKLFDVSSVEEDEDVVLLIVPDELAGERIDRYISDSEGISRSMAVKLIESGNIRVNKSLPNKNYRIVAGDEIRLSYPEPQPCEAVAEDIPLDIVYEDGDIIIVNKPSGMIVHPATGIYSGTLVNALLYHCGDSLSGIGGVVRPGIIHRIDKDTSGLLVVAKNDEAHEFLSDQLKTHDVSRIYHAIAIGNIKNTSGTVDKPIGRHPSDRKKMAVITDPARTARNAVTHYEVMERFDTPQGKFSYVKCALETGRTHQIRVHMSSIGHSLLGDCVYGGGNTKFEQSNKHLINGQCLHAKELSLVHPKTHEKMTFSCELPQEMLGILEKMRKMSFDI